MAEVRFENVHKQFGTRKSPRTVLKDITLSIKDREFMVLLGPSGCGKSTLLRMLAGLERISSGQILIDGRVVNDVPPSERDIAMVFQDYALYPHMTVRENLSFGLRMRKTPKDKVAEQVKMAASLLELEEVLTRKPSQLSGGQRQRVAIGRAIVRHPKVFLFDEPLSNLDAKLRSQTRAELADLHKRVEATTIYVTHDQIEAMTLADRIAILNEGNIHQVGTPHEVFHSPADKFVATFVGYPSMNLVGGELTADGFAAHALRLNGMERPAPNGQVTLGIRPEAIKVLKPDAQKFDLEAVIQLIEVVGNDEIVFVRAGRLNLVLRAFNLNLSERVDIGDKLKLAFDREGLLWFEPGEYGRRLLSDARTTTA